MSAETLKRKTDCGESNFDIQRSGRTVTIINIFMTEYDAIAWYDAICEALNGDGRCVINMAPVKSHPPLAGKT